MAQRMYLTPGTTYMIHLGGVYNDSNGIQWVISDGMFRNWLRESVLPYFDSFTITKADGYWKGQSEPTRVLTVCVNDPEDGATVHDIAKSFCDKFNQEAVFVNALTSCPNLVR